jgi:hypothetical protein
MSTEAELKKIERDEAKILANEKEILAEDHMILLTLRKMTGSIKGLSKARSLFVSRISKRKIVFGLLVTAGMVGVWRGTWYVLDEVSWLHSPYASIAFGVILLLVLKKINDLTDH